LLIQAGNYEHEAKVLREEKKQLLKKIDNLEQVRTHFQ
jgi:hypothetical protein